MMVGWLKALLFIGGGVTAAAGTAYVTGLLDPWLGREPTVIASLPSAQPQTQTPQPQAAAPAAEDAVPLPTETTTTDKQGRLVAPGFDLLRVEPDGSVVIAGRAAGDATVEIMQGETVLGAGTAGPEGDFVIVLDDPLAPGDYQLSLRSMSGDVLAVSPETAIVSVPETPDGQVLAMVEAPGAPAELITVPEAPAAAPSEEPEVAGEAPVEAVEQPGAAVAEGEAAVSDEQVASQAEEPAAQEEAAEAPTVETAADEQLAATTKDATATEDAATAPAAGAEPESEAAPQTDVAAAAPEQPADAGAQPAAEGSVVVEAVEIEGDTVFVAGQASPGRTVRVYANDVLLGDARASAAGRFLVETRRELPVGPYMIRADLLEADGTVVARAAVPFEREPGEAIAAVAPPAPAQTPQPAQEPAEQSPASAPQGGEAETADTQDAGEPEAETDIAAAPAADATAPALQRVDGSVIIRRGDSLWRISRRVYGRGIRYSTIYLANQQQIRNPDMIWPGQVFSVPQETPEGDVADMDAMGDQAVSPDAETAPVAQ
ncbi:LysM peptidoglycan-binding domain-containing protein [Mesorhizobium microcysteis]|uniref:LysM peptidoglycan-binding domain-containing protein n=2 Tax=Neoaquamicrobium microcysteis TaxID=2682781 RepID=A0A5D4GXU3_9HYPH|nr:LysM peptidoglycan-binding domain-containing protein [Mesorhizobium microcysteis]